MKKLFAIFLFIAAFAEVSFAQWVTETMPTPKCQLQIAEKDNKIYLIGGYGMAGLESTVDVYNCTTGMWEAGMNISSQRAFPAAVGGDSALYIAGGVESWIPDLTVGTNLVEIYKNGQWTTDLLPDSIFAAQAVHVGSKILISGGTKSYYYPTGVIVPNGKAFLYDEITHVWTTHIFSNASCARGVATDGTIAIFAGGIAGYDETTDIVDIYNSSTDTWTTATLSQSRAHIAGAYSNGKFFFAGGIKPGVNQSSDVVDIYDGSSWTTANIFFPRGNMQACAAGNLVFFTGGGNMNLPAWNNTSAQPFVDIYDVTQNTWTDDNLQISRTLHSAIGVGNKAYVAGGSTFSKPNITDFFEIYEVNTGIPSLSTGQPLLFPNPCSGMLTIGGATGKAELQEAQIIAVSGQVMKTIKGSDKNIDVSFLASGIYFLLIKDSAGISRMKFIKE